jgi:diadenosine tetraphosphate (Ap4A) HIT family hydrolase
MSGWARGRPEQYALVPEADDHRQSGAQGAPSMACFVCAKHRGDLPVPGGLVWQDELVVATHRIMMTPKGEAVREVYLGHLIVEPRRHAAELAELTDAEASAMGVASARLSRSLMSVLPVEHIYAMIVGDEVPHVHLHLLPRYVGTPREYWWDRVDEWPDAPRGDEHAVSKLVERLRVGVDQRS